MQRDVLVRALALVVPNGPLRAPKLGGDLLQRGIEGRVDVGLLASPLRILSAPICMVTVQRYALPSRTK